MAENPNKISQVQIGSTTYDICDAVARNGTLFSQQEFSFVSPFGPHGGNTNNNIKLYKIGQIGFVSGVATVTTTSLNVETEQPVTSTLPESILTAAGPIFICQGTGAHIWMLKITGYNNDLRVYAGRYQAGGTYSTINKNNWLPISCTILLKAK